MKDDTLASLPGLGPKAAGYLEEVGITTPEELRRTGAISAFLLLKDQCSTKPGLNFLYALVGAIENRPWLEVATEHKYDLLTALAAEEEMRAGRFGVRTGARTDK